jgi:hypothetical protein
MTTVGRILVVDDTPEEMSNADLSDELRDGRCWLISQKISRESREWTRIESHFSLFPFASIRVIRGQLNCSG